MCVLFTMLTFCIDYMCALSSMCGEQIGNKTAKVGWKMNNTMHNECQGIRSMVLLEF